MNDGLTPADGVSAFGSLGLTPHWTSSSKEVSSNSRNTPSETALRVPIRMSAQLQNYALQAPQLEWGDATWEWARPSVSRSSGRGETLGRAELPGGKSNVMSLDEEGSFCLQ